MAGAPRGGGEATLVRIQAVTPAAAAVVPVSFDTELADEHTRIVALDDSPLGLPLALHLDLEVTIDRDTLLDRLGALDVVGDAGAMIAGPPVVSALDERIAYRQGLADRLALLAPAGAGGEPDTAGEEALVAARLAVDPVRAACRRCTRRSPSRIPRPASCPSRGVPARLRSCAPSPRSPSSTPSCSSPPSTNVPRTCRSSKRRGRCSMVTSCSTPSAWSRPSLRSSRSWSTGATSSPPSRRHRVRCAPRVRAGPGRRSVTRSRSSSTPPSRRSGGWPARSSTPRRSTPASSRSTCPRTRSGRWRRRPAATRWKGSVPATSA